MPTASRSENPAFHAEDGCLPFRGSWLLCVVDANSVDLSERNASSSSSTSPVDGLPTEPPALPTSNDATHNTFLSRTPDASQDRPLPTDFLSRLLHLINQGGSPTSISSFSTSFASVTPTPSSPSSAPSQQPSTLSHASASIPFPSYAGTEPPVIKDDRSPITLIDNASLTLLLWSVLLVCATLILLLLFVCVLCLVCRRRRKSRSADEESKPQEEDHTVEYAFMFGDGASAEEVNRCLADAPSLLSPSSGSPSSSPLAFPPSLAGSNVKVWMRREGRQRKNLQNRSYNESS